MNWSEIIITVNDEQYTGQAAWQMIRAEFPNGPFEGEFKNPIVVYPVPDQPGNENEVVRNVLYNWMFEIGTVTFPADSSHPLEINIAKTVGNTIDTPPRSGFYINLLGDTYLRLRNTLRPEKPNSAKRQSQEAKINCSVVAGAAVLGVDTKALTEKLDLPLSYNYELTFLGKDAKNYHQFSSPNAEYVISVLGTEEDYKTRRIEELTNVEGGNSLGPDEVKKKVNSEYFYTKMKLRANNDLILKKIADTLSLWLGPGITVRRGGLGSGEQMLEFSGGVEAMKESPPGTQFIVLLDVAGKDSAPHYVYANNFGAKIHFVDYQPQPTEVDLQYPHTIDKPVPRPFFDISSQASSSSQAATNAAFSLLSFIAFEPTNSHMVKFIKAKNLGSFFRAKKFEKDIEEFFTEKGNDIHQFFADQ